MKKKNGFYKEEVEETIGRQLARKLRDALDRKSVGQNKSFSVSMWAKEIELLFPKVGQKRVELALDWYMKHIRERFVPQAYSARSFREKFDQIEAAADRSKQDSEGVIISERIQKLADDLAATCGWPPGTRDDLRDVCQLTYDNYSAFLDKLIAFIDRDPKSTLGRIAEDIRVTMGPPHRFTEHWWRSVSRKLRSWPSFTGSLKTFVWRTDIEMATYHGRAIVDRYCRRSRHWDTILNSLS